MFTHCPKCGHHPLPLNQALPAACPACGVILAKLVPAPRRVETREETDLEALDVETQRATLPGLLFYVPPRVDSMLWWLRLALLAGFGIWAFVLIRMDYRDGEIGSSFIHRPLLIFHEAGHVVFSLFGHWVYVLGGSLGQLVMPAILCGALLITNRDPFGASIGLWLLGVSLLDLAPYMYDALHPQLTLLSGGTGEEGGHDWIYLFTSMGLLAKSQLIGALVHKLGALVLLLALTWGARVLWLQRARVDGHVLHE